MLYLSQGKSHTGLRVLYCSIEVNTHGKQQQHFSICWLSEVKLNLQNNIALLCQKHKKQFVEQQHLFNKFNTQWTNFPKICLTQQYVYVYLFFLFIVSKLILSKPPEYKIQVLYPVYWSKLGLSSDNGDSAKHIHEYSI